MVRKYSVSTRIPRMDTEMPPALLSACQCWHITLLVFIQRAAQLPQWPYLEITSHWNVQTTKVDVMLLHLHQKCLSGQSCSHSCAVLQLSLCKPGALLGTSAQWECTGTLSVWESADRGRGISLPTQLLNIFQCAGIVHSNTGPSFLPLSNSYFCDLWWSMYEKKLRWQVVPHSGVFLLYKETRREQVDVDRNVSAFGQGLNTSSLSRVPHTW